MAGLWVRTRHREQETVSTGQRARPPTYSDKEKAVVQHMATSREVAWERRWNSDRKSTLVESLGAGAKWKRTCQHWGIWKQMTRFQHWDGGLDRTSVTDVSREEK